MFGSRAVSGVPHAVQQVNCEICKTTKSTQDTGKVPALRATERLDRAHMEFWGPYKTPTLGGKRYMLTTTDDFSRKSWIYLTKDRTEVCQLFRSRRTQVELESGQKLKAIRMDNAPEFIKLGKGFEQDGIRIELIVPYTPSQNGVAERLNRTLITKTRAMLTTARLPAQFWGEAAHAACYVKNLTLGEGKRIPQELWTGRIPDLSYLRTFGCIAYIHMPVEKRSKLDQTAVKGIFVRYGQTTRQYWILTLGDMKVKQHSSVKFDELQSGGTLLRTSYQGDEEGFEPALESGATRAQDVPGVNRGSPRLEEGTEEQSEPDEYDPESNIDVYRRPTPDLAESRGTTTEGRPQRNRRPPNRYKGNTTLKVDYSPLSEAVAPNSFDEAVHGKDARQWKLAIDEHLRLLEANHTWDVVKKPADANIISTKWVFKIKGLPNGRIDKYKARICGRGFTQEYGIDYFETFAPIVRMESLRILLALAAAQDWEIHQMDVVSAYLLGELEEDAYLGAPQGLELPKGKVLKAVEGLPGLKQSGRTWNRKITVFFEEHGLYSMLADHSVFVNKKRTLIVALYVDDLPLFALTVKEIQLLKQALSAALEMKDLGEAKFVLQSRVQSLRTSGSWHSTW